MRCRGPVAPRQAGGGHRSSHHRAVRLGDAVGGGIGSGGGICRRRPVIRVRGPHRRARGRRPCFRRPGRQDSPGVPALGLEHHAVLEGILFAGEEGPLQPHQLRGEGASFLRRELAAGVSGAAEVGWASGALESRVDALDLAPVARAREGRAKRREILCRDGVGAISRRCLEVCNPCATRKGVQCRKSLLHTLSAITFP